MVLNFLVYPLVLLRLPDDRELPEDLELLDERTLPEDLDEELLEDLTLPDDLEEELLVLLTLLDLVDREGELALVDLVLGLVTRVLERVVLVGLELLTVLDGCLVVLTVLVFPTFLDGDVDLTLVFLLVGEAALDNLRVE